MQCLWLTLADPDPAINGQLIYSKGLIESVAAAGARLTIVGLARPESPVRLGSDKDWHLATYRKRSRMQNLLSPVPVVATRGYSEEMATTIEQLLRVRRFDAVVFDSIVLGWALPMVQAWQAETGGRGKIVYLAHNHEISVARRVADAASAARRLVKELDAIKVRRLERRLIATSDLVTSNAPEDCRRFAAEPGVPAVAYLPPGYGGQRVRRRAIDASIPRRAIVVGSFDWPPKRISLEAFLDAAAPLLGHAGIELQIVGAIESQYLDAMRERYPEVDFVGPVEDVLPYMAKARVALVPDTLGGFKLKGLDYVFNRLPILAMRIALPGMPLLDGKSISLFDGHVELAQGVVRLIDDFTELNARHEHAYAACEQRFDWSRVGRHLLRHIGEAHRSSPQLALELAAKASPAVR